MDKQKRWVIAQKYELDWWTKYCDNIDWYEEFAKTIIIEVSPYIEILSDTNILEIGSGPAGGITYLDSNNKYAIDPLEDYFSTNEKWIKHRDTRVKYYVGKGEKLPFADNFFDLVILDNVLDHCENPIDVLDEINRVIKFGGIIFFRQHVYNYWGKLMRSFMELIKIDSGHPFTLIKYQLDQRLKNANVSVLVDDKFFEMIKNNEDIVFLISKFFSFFFQKSFLNFYLKLNKIFHKIHLYF